MALTTTATTMDALLEDFLDRKNIVHYTLQRTETGALVLNAKFQLDAFHFVENKAEEIVVR